MAPAGPLTDPPAELPEVPEVHEVPEVPDGVHPAWLPPAALAPLVVDKGSIAVDGVSLTVSAASAADAAEQWFEVSLIPETLAATTLGARVAGDSVNLETDILARHVQRLLAFTPERTAPTEASLTEGGSR